MYDKLSDCLSEHMALYDYVADRSEGLSFRKGETIAVIEVQDQGWWCGCAGNQLGWFPASYVEVSGCVHRLAG